jgi:hypothetical protein
VGWAAGLLGALVAGRLARRHQRAGRDAAPEASPQAPRAEASGSQEEAGDEVLVADWRREVRRQRLAVLEQHAAVPAGGAGHAVTRVMERGPRRGPSGREHHWHEALEATPA